MPNHVTNLVTFGTDSSSLSAFQQMAHDMKIDGEPLGSFDFNKLIPMPQELNIECGSKTDEGLKLYTAFMKERTGMASATMFAPEAEQSAAVQALLAKWDAIEKKNPEVWALGKRAFQNIQKYGCPTWYEWSNANWGTKWNAYQPEQLNSQSSTMRFLTAWASVPAIIQKLSEKYPDQTITYRWADEEIGYNVGRMVFQKGECIEEFILESGSRTAYEMAAEIVGADLASFGLYLNEDKTSYEYRDEPPVEQRPQAAKKSKQKGQSR